MSNEARDRATEEYSNQNSLNTLDKMVVKVDFEAGYDAGWDAGQAELWRRVEKSIREDIDSDWVEPLLLRIKNRTDCEDMSND